jgi:hypothetical protein
MVNTVLKMRPVKLSLKQNMIVYLILMRGWPSSVSINDLKSGKPTIGLDWSVYFPETEREMWK